jgi:hypothetical protein
MALRHYPTEDEKLRSNIFLSYKAPRMGLAQPFKCLKNE